MSEPSPPPSPGEALAAVLVKLSPDELIAWVQQRPGGLTLAAELHDLRANPAKCALRVAEWFKLDRDPDLFPFLLQRLPAEVEAIRLTARLLEHPLPADGPNGEPAPAPPPASPVQPVRTAAPGKPAASSPDPDPTLSSTPPAQPVVDATPAPTASPQMAPPVTALADLLGWLLPNEELANELHRFAWGREVVAALPSPLVSARQYSFEAAKRLDARGALDSHFFAGLVAGLPGRRAPILALARRFDAEPSAELLAAALAERAGAGVGHERDSQQSHADPAPSTQTRALPDAPPPIPSGPHQPRPEPPPTPTTTPARPRAPVDRMDVDELARALNLALEDALPTPAKQQALREALAQRGYTVLPRLARTRESRWVPLIHALRHRPDGWRHLLEEAIHQAPGHPRLLNLQEHLH